MGQVTPALSLSIASIVASPFIADRADADFVGASLELTEDDGPGGAWTWRVYVDFDAPTDVLHAIRGIPDTVALSFRADDDLFNDGGVFSDMKPEDFPARGITGARDSWITIGDDLGFPTPTDYSPGFAGSDGVTSIIKGSSWSDTSGGWFNGAPGNPVQGTHILIAQFTLPHGANFTLSGMADWSAGAGGIVDPGFFSIATPAPGALALFGFAAIGTRRRRRQPR